MTEDTAKKYEKTIKRLFEDKDKAFDEECGLIGMEAQKNVIHTKIRGYVHRIDANAVYAQLVYMSEAEHRYKAAENIINSIITAQDKRRESATYGLWAYYFEESLEEMSAPDYNMAEFVARPLIYIIMEKRDLINGELAEKIKDSLRLAAHCCIKRNVGLDYSNVASMSCVTITLIGEITDDAELIRAGSEELKNFLEYTRFNGGFSEFNSPCYFKVVGDSAARMIKYFRNEENRKMAEELNNFLWKMVSEHYSQEYKELAPPYVRAYSDTDIENENKDFIYFATDGKYGAYTGSLHDWVLNVPECPKEYYKNFEQNIWLEDAYYKKNNLRNRSTDATIVRDFDSPDLVAYTYKSKEYMFGALQKTDLWVQRRTSMLLWDKSDIKTFKLQCIKDDFSFSSGMAYTAASKDEMLTAVGFCTDHGDKHYILDLFNDGKIKAKKLAFSMRLSENCPGGAMQRNGNEFTYKDGKISFSVRIEKWVFDGEPGEIRFDGNGFELICFDGDEREVDLTAIKDTYGIISMKINGTAPWSAVTSENGRVRAEADNGFLIDCYSAPNKYDLCMRNTMVLKK